MSLSLTKLDRPNQTIASAPCGQAEVGLSEQCRAPGSASAPTVDIKAAVRLQVFNDDAGGMDLGRDGSERLDTTLNDSLGNIA